MTDLVEMARERQRIAREKAYTTHAADDQKNEIAEQVIWIHVARGVIVGHHRNQVTSRFGVGALVPQPREAVAALAKLRQSLFRAVVKLALRQSGGEIGPSRQLAAVFPRKIEQGGEHLGCQFDGNPIDPIERLVPR